MMFQEMGLSAEILKAIAELGFTQPTPIQEQTIPVILAKDHDLVALAQTGTGKTAAFGLPIIGQVDVANDKVQALVLAPTRELCVQIAKDFESYSKHIKGLKVQAVYGGASIVPQARALRKGAQIVVGTPGRTLDFIRRGDLRLADVRWLVLDEADEMLKMGFQEDMDAILAATPDTRQTLLFSATMPKEIVGLTRRYMKNPEEISVAKNTGAKNVEHWYYVVNVRERYNALKRIADLHPDIYGIVFCKTRAETQEIADQLIQDHYNADSLHGDLSQAQRDQVMGRFRSGHLQLLIATDVAARGLDVNDLTHVINFRLPDSLDSYIHRSGRTGRAGKDGISISLLGPREVRNVKILERQVGKPFVQKRIPTGEEILGTQLFNYLDRIEKVEVDLDKMGPFLPGMYKKLEGMTREELIQHFVGSEFNRLLDYYKRAGDINIAPAPERKERGERGMRGDRPERGERGERFERGGDRQDRFERGERPERGSRGSVDYTRFFVNLGRKSKITPQRLMSLVNDFEALRGAPIGKIEIQNNFSFFEVGGQAANYVVSEMNGVDYLGTTLSVENSVTREAPEHSMRPRTKARREEGKEPFWKRFEKPHYEKAEGDKPKKDKKAKKDKKDKKAKTGTKKLVATV